MKTILLFLLAFCSIGALNAQTKTLSVQCSGGTGKVALNNEILQNATIVKSSATCYTSSGYYTPGQNKLIEFTPTEGADYELSFSTDEFPGAVVFEISYSAPPYYDTYVGEFNDCFTVNCSSPVDLNVAVFERDDYFTAIKMLDDNPQVGVESGFFLRTSPTEMVNTVYINVNTPGRGAQQFRVPSDELHAKNEVVIPYTFRYEGETFITAKVTYSDNTYIEKQISTYVKATPDCSDKDALLNGPASVEVNENAVFSVDVKNPCSESYTVVWTKNGEFMGTGYSIAIEASVLGVHLIRAEITFDDGTVIVKDQELKVTLPPEACEREVFINMPSYVLLSEEFKVSAIVETKCDENFTIEWYNNGTYWFTGTDKILSYNTAQDRTFEIVVTFEDGTVLRNSDNVTVIDCTDRKITIHGSSNIEYGESELFTKYIEDFCNANYSVQWFIDDELVSTDESYRTENTLADGTYEIKVVATFEDGLTEEATMNIIVEGGPVQEEDISGKTCVRKGSTENYILSPSLLVNSSGVNWTFTGGGNFVPTGNQVSITFPDYFTGGAVCAGVNYNVAPWHSEYCLNVELCPDLFTIGPNPTSHEFTVTALVDIYYFTVANPAEGWSQHVQGVSANEIYKFAAGWNAGTYIITAYTQSGETQSKTVIKN